MDPLPVNFRIKFLAQKLRVKVNRIRMVTPEKVNKRRLHGRCPDDVTTLAQFFHASQAVHAAHDVTTLPFRAGQFPQHLWSPTSYSYLLQQAGVPNLILLTLAACA